MNAQELHKLERTLDRCTDRIDRVASAILWFYGTVVLIGVIAAASWCYWFVNTH